MKKSIVKVISAILSLAMTVSILCSCGDKPKTDNTSDWQEEEVVEYEEIVESDGNSVSSGNSPDKNNSSAGSNSSDKTNNSSSSKNNSGSNQNSNVDASSADGFLASMPKKLKGTTIKYFYWWDPKTQMEKDAIAAFEKKTGITVKPEVGSYKTFQTELAAKIAAGNSPDIVRLLSNAMYQVKCLQPITNSGYDFSDDIWWKKLMKDYTYNGKTYAVNIRPKDAAILDTYMIYYNKRALRAADMQDPYQLWKKNPKSWTWSKLWSMCDEFVKANNNKSGYYGISFQYNNAYVRMFGCANYDYNSKTGKWENYMSSPELAKRWSELISYNTKGLSAINHDSTSFQRAKILFDGAGPFACRNGDQTHQILKDRGELGVVPIPTDSPYQLLYEYTAFGIPQGAKNAQAVPYYLRYVLDKNNYDLDKIYYDAQAKDVVEYTLSFADNKYFFGENEIYDLRQALVNGTADQVKSTLASYKGVIQETVDSCNEQIKYLSK